MSLFHLQVTYCSREILKHAILLTINVDYLRGKGSRFLPKIAFQERVETPMRGKAERAIRVSPQSLSVFTLLAPVSSFDCSPFLTYVKMRAALKSSRLHAGFSLFKQGSSCL